MWYVTLDWSALQSNPDSTRRYPDVIARRTLGANEHGICHRRGLTVQPVTPIPDLRSDLDQPPVGSPQNRPPFQGFKSNFFYPSIFYVPRKIPNLNFSSFVYSWMCFHFHMFVLSLLVLLTLSLFVCSFVCFIDYSLVFSQRDRFIIMWYAF